MSATPDVVAVTAPRISPSGDVAVLQVYPNSAPQAVATTNLVNHLRHDVLPALEHKTGVPVLVGGFTAGSIDFSHVLSGKLPLFFGIVILLSAGLLFVIFRSLVIPVQAAIMNLLTIGAALGVTVAVFQNGWFASVLGVEKGPIEAWVPVIMFAVVFGLSMDYEVFLVSRIREQWIRKGDASVAVGDGIALTGRVITAAAAIMVCVFLSFTLGDQRTLKEFGFGLAVAVFLDALVVRCVLLPAVLEILGPSTWWLPRWLDTRLPHINIEGSTARAEPDLRHPVPSADPRSPKRHEPRPGEPLSPPSPSGLVVQVAGMCQHREALPLFGKRAAPLSEEERQAAAVDLERIATRWDPARRRAAPESGSPPASRRCSPAI